MMRFTPVLPAEDPGKDVECHAPYMSLDDLLAVIENLVPHERICFSLLNTLRGSQFADAGLSPGKGAMYRLLQGLETEVQGDRDRVGRIKLHQHVQDYSSFRGLSIDSHLQVKKPFADMAEGSAVSSDCMLANIADTPSKSKSGQMQILEYSVPASVDDAEPLVGGSQQHMQGTESSASPLPTPVPSKAPKMFKAKAPVPWLPDGYEGSAKRRCFLMFEETKSRIGQLIAAIVVATILVSTLGFILESMPEFRYTPAECGRLLKLGLPLTVQACEPKPDPTFSVVESICIAIFTVDYLVRICTAHSVPARDSDQNALGRTMRYAMQPINIIDFLAVFPFYVNMALGEENQLPLLRGLRLLRIFRVLKLTRHIPGVDLFVEVMSMSGQPLLILVFFNLIIAVLFGSLMYYAEGQTFSIDPEFTQPIDGEAAAHPLGVFVRKDKNFLHDEVTPFRSIPRAMWWVCVTMTTVGYGEFYPTTRPGKVIGVACFYVGIIFLALPISVLGNNFEIVYLREMAKKLERARGRGEEKKRSMSKRKSRSTMFVYGTFPRTESWRKNLFLTFDDASASVVGKYMSVLMMTIIVLSTTSFVMESMPAYNKTPDACDPESLTVIDCRPVPDKSFYLMEMVCVIVFTIDYLVRVSMVHVCRPEECGLVLKDDEKEPSAFRKTMLYCFLPLNIVDLVAILPFYVELLGFGGGGAAVLRVLRLVRAFRVLKQPKLRACADMLLRVVFDAIPALCMLILMSTMTCVFFASCIVFAECSEFSVDPMVSPFLVCFFSEISPPML
eukprot:TRINITY_DN12125_c0_g1_i2.p1 TRINITY_DN12125_c0_g1~~TRINITY_DN12125_c0_g1_i2.p1  ORF type:complete len:786 (+),score=141.82 TRINITY_DN12125_c0_g1_i2:136-2493(+)